MATEVRWVRRIAAGAVAGLCLALGCEVGTVWGGRNFHTLVPGHVYRSAQPSPADIADYASRYGIRTIVNLRGCCSDCDWYLDECRATAALDLALEDVSLSAGKLPSPPELRRLVEVLDHAEYPLLLHCRQGVDRTGLTSVIIKMLYEGASPAEARKQLSWRYGHLSIGRTVAMLNFFELYDTWRARMKLSHSPAALREFIGRGYCAGPASAELSVVDVPAMRRNWPAGITIRAVNRSPEVWHFRPGTGAGVHVRFAIYDADGDRVHLGCAGMLEAAIEPGNSIDLVLPIPSLRESGKYALSADLYGTPDVSFAQLGSEPLALELNIP